MKTKKLSTTISKSKLSSLFAYQYQKIPSTTEKQKSNLSFKDMAETYRNMDIAKVAGHRPEGDTHNLLSASPLFDGDLPARTNKSILLGIIEPKLDFTQWCQESTAATHVVVDFMSKMRQMPL